MCKKISSPLGYVLSVRCNYGWGGVVVGGVAAMEVYVLAGGCASRGELSGV